MKLVLSCPVCGGIEFARVNDDGSFTCATCGEESFPEDMTAKRDEDDMENQH